MKKAISGILCLVFLTLGAISAQAASVDLLESATQFELVQDDPNILYSAYTNTTNTSINISGTQATSEGYISGYSGVTTKVRACVHSKANLLSKVLKCEMRTIVSAESVEIS